MCRQASNLVAHTRAQNDAALTEEMDTLRKQKSLTRTKGKIKSRYPLSGGYGETRFTKRKRRLCLPRPLKIEIPF